MTDMAGYRRAAVALHALGEADRQWILASLPLADRGKLDACLAEFTALGFSAEIASAAAAGESAEPPALQCRIEPELAMSSASCLRSADPAVLAELLRDEPPVLIARLMRGRNWPWAPTVLAALPSARRDAVQAAIDAIRPAAACQAFLEEQVAGRIRTLPANPAAADRAESTLTIRTTRVRSAAWRKVNALARVCQKYLMKAAAWTR